MSKTPIRVVLVDDHTLLRDSLEAKLAAEPGLEVVGSFSSADGAVENARSLAPNVFVFDIDMPGVLSFEAAASIRRVLPEARFVFLSGFLHDRYIEDALRVEASAYVTKNEHYDTILAAIKAAAEGSVFFSPDVMRRLVIDREGATLVKNMKSRMSMLSPREIEVIRYTAKGLTDKEIARLMGIAPKTVDSHATSIRAKLDLHDRVQMTLFALREGLIEL